MDELPREGGRRRSGQAERGPCRRQRRSEREKERGRQQRFFREVEEEEKEEKEGKGKEKEEVKRKEEESKWGGGREGSSFPPLLQRASSSESRIRGDRSGPFPRGEEKIEAKGKISPEEEQEEEFTEQLRFFDQEERVPEQRGSFPRISKSEECCKEGPRGIGRSGLGRDAGELAHVQRASMGSGFWGSSSSINPTLLPGGAQGEDEWGPGSRGFDVVLPYRPCIARSSGRSPRRGATASQVSGAHCFWGGLQDQSEVGTGPPRYGGSCLEPGAKGSPPRSERRTQVEGAERKRQRLVEERDLERKQQERWQREERRRQGERERRRSLGEERGRRCLPGKKEGGEEERVREEEDPPKEDWDGEAWSPDAGEDITMSDFGEMLEVQRMRGANNLSMPREAGIGWAPKDGSTDSFNEEERLSPALRAIAPTTEGASQDLRQPGDWAGKTLGGEMEREDSSLLSVEESYETAAESGLESGLAGLTFGRISKLVADMWTGLMRSGGLRCKTQPLGRGIFPLPTVHSARLGSWLTGSEDALTTFYNLARGLNMLAGWGPEDFTCSEGIVQQRSVEFLFKQADRICTWREKFDELTWEQFFRVKGVDYRGEEILVARFVEWKHLSPALPDEVGTVDLERVVELGTLHYVTHFEEFLLPEEDRKIGRAPKVMIPPEAWEEVAAGLVSKGICGIIGEDEVFRVGDQLLLNGLFGVSKNEWKDGVEVHRLIMNLIPVNDICRGIEGDVGTLPAWSTLSPMFLLPGEDLVISSEDVKCFFYIFKIPEVWYRYMAFNRPLPPSLCPPGKAQRYFLCSHVLPMGFKNSVAVAQHIHRNVIRWSGRHGGVLGESSGEVRKDRPFSFSNPLFRIYLDNFDQLEKVDSRISHLVSGKPSLETLAIRSEYEAWGIPNHPKKSVCQKTIAEVQGGMVDGKQGIVFPKPEKVLKYVQLAIMLLNLGKASLKQIQVVGGGLVYLAMFRRPLLGALNGIWTFAVELDRYHPVTRLPIPEQVRLELIRFVSLVPLSFMDFRVSLSPDVTASDASTTGGGVTVTRCLSEFGQAASLTMSRGDIPGMESHSQILSIGLFDGIGALRVALDCLEVSCCGHISVETSATASRVVEAHFPGSLLVQDVTQVTEVHVKQWACKFSSAAIVIVGAGPPCQGVSGLNSERKGALKDERSKLFKEVKRIVKLVKKEFRWAIIHLLMESVKSMDEADREAMSADVEIQPWAIDAVGLSLARRPRLYWLTWELLEGEGVLVHPPRTDSFSDFGAVDLQAEVNPKEFLTKGWVKASEEPFPTFTTSRPRSSPGPRPAGLKHCDVEERQRWEGDSFRFPPYQYKQDFLVKNSDGSVRMPNIQEKEAIMGFPLNYTASCMGKSEHKKESYLDCRLSLIGNSWNVTVVVWLLNQLLHPLGLCPPLRPQDCVNRTKPGQGRLLESCLLRPPFSGHRPFKLAKGAGNSLQLVRKLTGLVSIKGEDILLTAPTEIQVKHHRLRSSVPSKLWKWRTICGWRWTGSPEHINVLELRAAMTAIKWRLEKCREYQVKFVHLIDSQVVLHALSRGRSSSRKLRRTLLRVNSLLLATGSVGVWAYVHTSDNPADRPSRRPVKRRWGK